MTCATSYVYNASSTLATSTEVCDNATGTILFDGILLFLVMVVIFANFIRRK